MSKKYDLSLLAAMLSLPNELKCEIESTDQMVSQNVDDHITAMSLMLQDMIESATNNKDKDLMKAALLIAEIPSAYVNALIGNPPDGWQWIVNGCRVYKARFKNLDEQSESRGEA